MNERFQLQVKLPPKREIISHDTSLLMMGSCFSVEIGKKLMEGKIATLINPFGNVFNPYSIARNLEELIENKQYTEKDLFEHGGLWHSWSHHGSYSNSSKEVALFEIRESIEAGALFLRMSNVLIITLGSAWAYKLKSSGNIVANCHKVPNKEFLKVMLELDELKPLYEHLLNRIHALNPKLEIILTLSPVRHWKDGATENQRSKATLMLLIDRLQKQFDFVDYFPAYEIMMDELRDYRFYKEDMIHPSQQAVDFIWRRFAATYMSETTQNILQDAGKVKIAQEHQFLYNNPEAIEQFTAQMLTQIEDLQKIHPGLDWELEKEYFKMLNNPFSQPESDEDRPESTQK